MRCAGLLLAALSALVGPGGPVQAARIDGSDPPVLIVDQWLETDAQGLLVQSAIQARLRRSGSTAAGLSSAWSPALDRTLDAQGLQMVALAWRDPPLPGSAPRQTVESGGAAAGWGAPIESAATRIGRLSALAAQQSQEAAPALAARIARTLQDAGAAEAWFNFRQRLPVAGQPRQVSWTLHVAASGVWFAGTPAVDAPGSAVLHVVYIPLAAAKGLPAAYRYQDAGWLRWQVADAAGHPQMGAGARDTGGAFDGSSGLACLLGVAPTRTCDPLQEAIPGLIERLGAAQADLTVASALQPVYAASAAGRRYALARLEIQRSLQGGDPACAAPPWRFSNAYQAAFLLQARLDHYQRGAAGQWSLLSSSNARMSGPVAPWKQLSVPVSGLLRAELDQLAIDPDRGQLVRLDAFPAGLQQVSASAVLCQPAPPASPGPLSHVAP